MCNGVAEQKLDLDLIKTIISGQIQRFLKKKSLPNRCGMGVWRYTCPNLIRMMHQMVWFYVTKCCESAAIFFQEDFELGLDPKIELEVGSIPRYHQTVSWGAWGIRTAA